MIWECTLIKGICLLCSCLFLWANIWIGCSSSARPLVTAMVLVKGAWSGSKRYCLSYKVRNTLCTCLSYVGRPSQQAMGLKVSAYCITT